MRAWYTRHVITLGQWLLPPAAAVLMSVGAHVSGAEREQLLQCLSALAWQRDQEYARPADLESAFRRGPFSLPDSTAVASPWQGPSLPSREGESVEVTRRLAEGVRALHWFSETGAETWFRDAVRLDDQSAGAWLGLAMANERLPARALFFLERAAACPGRTPRHDAWIVAYERFLRSAQGGELLSRLGTLGEDLAGVAQRFPEDGAAAMFALRYRIIRANLEGLGLSDADDVETALKRGMDQPGGDALGGYSILLWLKSKPERAAAAARAVPMEAPASGLRLAAEPLLATGDYETAIRYLQRAAASPAAYADLGDDSVTQQRVRTGSAVSLAWAYHHMGRERDAAAVAEVLLQTPRKPGVTALHMVDDDPQDAYLQAWRLRAQLFMAAEDWAALTGSLGGNDSAADGLLVRTYRQYWRALAAGSAGDTQTAAAARSMLSHLSQEVARTPYLNRHAELTARMTRGAAAFEQLQRGRITPFLKDVVDLPPCTMARLLVRAKASSAAQALLEEQLKLHPRSVPLTALLQEVKEGRPVSAPMPSAARAGGESIPPPAAPALELPDKSATMVSLESFRGRPVLVIFFLGQGCTHCVEQLQGLRPHVPSFTEAGISIVTVGTDDVAKLQESLGPGPELNPDMPFIVLADEKMQAFAKWRCVDQFLGKPLHGTFLLDEMGRVLWSDFSHDPWRQPEFLLGDCRRLLQQGHSVETTVNTAAGDQ